ncbi:hypothetical protein DMB44_05440 [Thermoplasma sp. Kam2015]|uniref:hypothetical protein n=1 Tax=Thermoplasma sp. Kam2015 TaxID=2094122 RepID=UPI000D954E30|nr:hypothetical protein [Thermoplasma sp. Kam2015]PYB68165.1 hypothetical protein DMB44_05440 [Thermoplasma sp. Kam2015]
MRAYTAKVDDFLAQFVGRDAVVFLDSTSRYFFVDEFYYKLNSPENVFMIFSKDKAVGGIFSPHSFGLKVANISKRDSLFGKRFWIDDIDFDTGDCAVVEYGGNDDESIRS